MAHHIGETPPKTPCEYNSVLVGMMLNVDALPRDVRQVHLRRHPRSPPGAADRLVRGRDRLGAVGSPGRRAPAGVLPAHVQPPARARRPVLLGQPHERVVHGRPAGPPADRPDRRRPGDVVVGLPAQREHVRLLGEVARVGGRRGRPGRRHQDRQQQHQEVPGRVHDHLREGRTVRVRTFPTSPTSAGCGARSAPGCGRRWRTRASTR